jgi:hypothetical protein
MKGSRQISVRLPDDQMEQLKNYCEQTESDITGVVRKALQNLLAAETGSSSGKPKGQLAPSEAVLDLVPAYLNRTDVREVRRSLFCHLLAASYVAKKHFPRTSGLAEGHELLLKLQKLFGVD